MKPRSLALLAVCATLLLVPNATVAAQEQTRQPTRADAALLIEKLDHHFNAGDLSGYMACFEPLHKKLFANIRLHIGQVIGKKALVSKSRIIEFERRGAYGVVLTVSNTHCRAQPALGMKRRSCLAFKIVDGRPRALFQVDAREGSLKTVRSGRFTCPACNYRIASCREWVTVPTRRSQSGCMESLTMLSLHHDLCVEFSVHVDQNGQPALSALRSYLQHLGPASSTRARDSAREWTPPFYAKKGLPKKVTAARAAFRVAATDKTDARLSAVHLVAHGPMRYVLAMHSGARIAAAAKAAAERLFHNFALLMPEADPYKVGAAAIRAHTGGGTLKGNTYYNPTHQVRLQGPAGFTAHTQAGGYLFVVRFVDKEGHAEVSFRGVAPYPGMKHWSDDAADVLLRRTLQRAHRKAAPGTGWRTNATVCPGFRCRQTESTSPQQDRHLVRMAWRGKLLVFMEARLSADASTKVQQAVLAAMDSLSHAN